jgi:DNA-binding LacI/PurR family transcriptional regulator
MAMNIEAVARRARVSTATVSRTINGLSTVHPKTAERVNRAIAALGFHPNVNARALGSGRSNLYGLIISDITNPFFPELVKAFDEIAVAHRREILIANSDYDSERMEQCVSRMLQRRVDGVAIMTSEMDERFLQDFSFRNIPMVVLDAGSVGPRISNISIDYQAGMMEAVQHLVDFGHTEIGFITGPLRLPSAQIRYSSFLAARDSLKLSAHPEYIIRADHSALGGYRAIRQLISSYPRITALICSNDLTAIGAMQAAYEMGLRLPEDLSIIGYDDISLSAFAHPSMTTVCVPGKELASITFKSLLRLEEKTELEGEGEQHRVSTHLVRRQSTAQIRH